MKELCIFVAGFLTGAAWSAINLFFTFRLLHIALLREEKARLYLTLLIKFPLLYLIGFIILASRVFPVISLLLGLGSSLLTISVIKFLQRHS